ncbi:MAG TPA: HPP family protein [Casimicrobiaceae bacterium]|nr:HPP family protein [Casimicrobiaceae bacterium]
MRRSRVARLLWCGIGVAAGMAVAFSIASTTSPVFLASLGGSAVFLFGLTRAAAAQPRALFGGHLGGALVGIAGYQLLGDALWVYAAVEIFALWLMLVTRTAHPPAGANPIIMVHGHAGWTALWQPVGFSVLGLALVAVAWSRLFPGLAAYPTRWLDPSPPTTFWGGWDE